MDVEDLEWYGTGEKTNSPLSSQPSTEEGDLKESMPSMDP